MQEWKVDKNIKEQHTEDRDAQCTDLWISNLNDLSKVVSTKSTLGDGKVVSVILYRPPQLPNGFLLRTTSDDLFFLSASKY
jgi:hypothetical protein